MQFTELDPKDIAAGATAVGENTPFVMLNLLRYKKEADYGGSSEYPACSGREAYYQRYVPAFAKIAAKSEHTKNFKPAFVGMVLGTLVGAEDEPWMTSYWWSMGITLLFVTLQRAPTMSVTLRRTAGPPWRTGA